MVHLVTLHYEREKRAIKSFVTGERERERVSIKLFKEKKRLAR